jgi:putative spermidine/putrescine transport system substrate-binding protein
MRTLLLALAAAALALPAAGVGSSSGLPGKIGPGEGKLTLLAWEGYVEQQWVVPFERTSDCEVDVRYAASAEEMVRLLAASKSRFDLVSASGEAGLRLVQDDAVQPVNVELVPGWSDFIEPMRSPAFNTVDGVHYGISVMWGVNSLLYNTAKVKPAPTSWSAIYDLKYAGRIAIPDNPLQIADAALYLSKTKPALGIRDPYALTRRQFDAAIVLLERQRPLVRSYWTYAKDEVSLFKRGKAWLGPAWQYQAKRLVDERVPVREVIPREGATGWADTWMLSSQAEHPNCAYRWLRWISTARVQAQQSVFFGATPASRLACKYMNRIEQGSCARYHANAPLSYSRRIEFWKTPVADCGNRSAKCVPYAEWVQAWQELRG